ncbi:hypothetical protein HDU67_003127, partial [Dinochytrium kinnereticum]
MGVPDEILDCLKGISVSLNNFSNSFDPSTQPQEASHVLQQIFVQHESLNRLLDKAEVHCARQNELRSVQGDIYDCNGRILNMLQQLKTAEDKLENILKQAEERRRAMQQTNQ